MGWDDQFTVPRGAVVAAAGLYRCHEYPLQCSLPCLWDNDAADGECWMGHDAVYLSYLQEVLL